MARCRDTTEDQLMYSETRLEDVRQHDIQLLSKQNARIKDVCRFFHGDHPSQEVETGEQIGGGYGCCRCTGASANYINHVGSLRPPHNSIRAKEKSARGATWERTEEWWHTSLQDHEQRRPGKGVQRGLLTH